MPSLIWEEPTTITSVSAASRVGGAFSIVTGDARDEGVGERALEFGVRATAGGVGDEDTAMEEPVECALDDSWGGEDEGAVAGDRSGVEAAELGGEDALLLLSLCLLLCLLLLCFLLFFFSLCFSAFVDFSPMLTSSATTQPVHSSLCSHQQASKAAEPARSGLWAKKPIKQFGLGSCGFQFQIGVLLVLSSSVTLENFE